MSRCKFLVDECVPSSLVRGLRRRCPEVQVVQVGEPGAPPKGVSDSEILEYCEREQRLLITADRATVPDFVRRHNASGGRTWGVFVVGQDVSLGRILDELVLVHEASEAHEWIDLLYYLPFLP